MLRIQSLLNPPASDDESFGNTAHSGVFCPPPTPALTSSTSNASFSPRMGTPDVASPAKRQKLVKDAPVFVKSEAKGQVNYPPYESNEDIITLAPHQRDELVHQHRRFKIYPSGSESDGLISDFRRRIPYSSDKKDFFGQTGWEGFDVYQYTFAVPEDQTKKVHTVMWDYNTGLVRITPFFKACKYSKTTPAKALNANPGLKEMSHSVTGGALVAQGYWMPYSCARAICLTFAYPIRWALTPIFGPSFICECLQPSHPGFARFKIDSETIRCDRMAMEGMMTASTGSAQQQGGIPRSVPEEHPSEQAVRAARPKFKLGSPFDSESEVSAASASYGLAMPSALNSPAISPKTTTFEPSGWTSINHNHQQHRPTNIKTNNCSAPPSPPPNTPYNPLDSALLTEPPWTTWRPDPVFNDASHIKPTASHKPARCASVTASTSDSASEYSTSSSDSSSDEAMDIDDRYTKPVLRTQPSFKKVGSPYTAASRSGTEKSKKYTAEDYRAAKLLLELSDRAGSLDRGSPVRMGKGKGKGRVA